MGAELGITPVIIRGEELKQKGFGGTFSVDNKTNSPFFNSLFASIISIPNISFSLQDKRAAEKFSLIQVFMESARQQNILLHLRS